MDKLIPISNNSLESSTSDIKYTTRESAKTKRDFYYEILKTSPAILILIMEELNHIQDHSLDSSKHGNEFTQGETTDCDFGEDLIDLLQLDDVIAEGQVVDDLPIKCCEGHLVNEISQTVNTLEKNSEQSKDLKENKKNDLMHNGSKKKEKLKIRIKDNKCRVDKISCDPYIIEDHIALIDAHEDLKISEQKKEKFARKRKRIIRKNDYDFEELREIKDKKNRQKEKESNKKFIAKVIEGGQETEKMSIEEADRIFKALVDNISETNDQDVGLQCKSCGFYSENVQERIEHLNGERHAARRDVRNAIRNGILESYTVNTFFCTMCSWFITDISSIIEHILSRRHEDAELKSRHKMCSFCNDCKSIIKSNKICSHISGYNHTSISYYFIQLEKHVLIEMKGKKEVYCEICNCYVRFDVMEKHLEDHEEVCYYFNNTKIKKCNSYVGYECKWPHKCVLCRGDHPQIDCKIIEQKKAIPVLDHENSKFGSQHENVMVLPKMSYKNLEGSDILSDSKGNFDRKVFIDDANNSLLPENAEISKAQKKSPTSYYKQNANENESSISKQLPKNYIKDRISYPDENDRNSYKSYQESKLSRTPKINCSSKSTSHRTNDRARSKSYGFDGRFPTNEHPSRKQLTQSKIKQEVKNSCLIPIDVHSIDVIHSDDKGEFKLIATIVELLEICNLLGNLGYFFANALKKALEKEESKEVILNILRENANIILMEVILKKLEACKRAYDMELDMKIKRGIKNLTYLIDITKKSVLKDS